MTRAELIEQAARALVSAIERAECAQSQPAYRNAREDWGEAEDALRAALSTQEDRAPSPAPPAGEPARCTGGACTEFSPCERHTLPAPATEGGVDCKACRWTAEDGMERQRGHSCGRAPKAKDGTP